MNLDLQQNPIKDFTSVNQEERKKIRIKSGDTVKVWIKIKEKDKVRLQAFEGLVLSVKHGTEPGATFTVRKVSNGVGIEKIFPLYSPNIDKIEITKKGQVRKSKLYYLREKVAREIRRQMRRAKIVSVSTTSDIEENEKKIKEAEQMKKAEEEAQKVEEEKRAEQEKVEAEKKVQEETEKSEEKPQEEKEDEEKAETPVEEEEEEAETEKPVEEKKGELEKEEAEKLETEEDTEKKA